jgi:transposase
VQLVNGSHSNVCFFGAVSDDKTHCCTAKWINEDSFMGFARYLLRLYEKVVLIVDRARWHLKSGKVKRLVKALRGRLILWPLPKRLPELNPMEPGWRSARQNVTWKMFPDRKSLGWAVKSHIRSEFRINLAKFWS